MFIYLTSKFVTWHHAPTWNSHFCWLVPKIDDQKHWRSSVNKLTTLNPCWSISKLNSIDPRPSYWSWPWPRYYAEHAFVCFVQLLNFHELIFWHLIFWFFIWYFSIVSIEFLIFYAPFASIWKMYTINASITVIAQWAPRTGFNYFFNVSSTIRMQTHQTHPIEWFAHWANRIQYTNDLLTDCTFNFNIQFSIFLDAWSILLNVFDINTLIQM